MMKTLQDGGVNISNFQREYEQNFENLNLSMFNQSSASNLSNSETLSERNSPISYEESESTSAIDLTANECNFPDETITPNNNWNGEDFWRKYCQFFNQQEPCTEKCELSFSEHYHCVMDYCNMVFK